MQNRDLVERLLEEQRTERTHQMNFIEQLRNTYGLLNKKGWKHLTPLTELIATWERNLSVVETQIEKLENIPKDVEKDQ